MAVRIGVNPIGWSNDDMRELGGATPLETCLTEAKEAGFEGMELGHKFPREADGARGRARRVRARSRLRLVFGASCCGATRTRRCGACGRISSCSRRWAATVLVFAETSNAIHGDRARPLAERPTLARRRLGAVRSSA